MFVQIFWIQWFKKAMSKTDCIKRAIILANNIAINSRKNDALFCKSNYIADPNKCFVLNCFVKPVEVSPFFSYFTFVLYKNKFILRFPLLSCWDWCLKMCWHRSILESNRKASRAFWYKSDCELCLRFYILVVFNWLNIFDLLFALFFKTYGVI